MLWNSTSEDLCEQQWLFTVYATSLDGKEKQTSWKYCSGQEIGHAEHTEVFSSSQLN